MPIRSLRAFLAVHHLGTIAAAADRVHLSPAAVSAQLKMLEQKLGAELFVRTSRSLRLTSTGHRLIPLAEQMIALHEEMLMLAQDEVVTGHLALGVVNSALTGVLPPILHRLKIETANLEVKIIAGNSAELLAQVENGILDAAIVTRPPKQVISNLYVHHLYSEPYALLLPEPISYDSLGASFQSSPYIAFDRHTWAGRQIDDFLHRLGIEVHPEMELNSLDAVTAVVRQGLGITIVPLVRGNLRHLDPLLRVILIPGFHREVCLVERKNHPQSKLTAQVLGAFSRLTLENEKD